jgi:hypothetical protein
MRLNFYTSLFFCFIYGDFARSSDPLEEEEKQNLQMAISESKSIFYNKLAQDFMDLIRSQVSPRNAYQIIREENLSETIEPTYFLDFINLKYLETNNKIFTIADLGIEIQPLNLCSRPLTINITAINRLIAGFSVRGTRLLSNAVHQLSALDTVATSIAVPSPKLSYDDIPNQIHVLVGIYCAEEYPKYKELCLKRKETPDYNKFACYLEDYKVSEFVDRIKIDPETGDDIKLFATPENIIAVIKCTFLGEEPEDEGSTS